MSFFVGEALDTEEKKKKKKPEIILTIFKSLEVTLLKKSGIKRDAES